jgi:small ligand-binding sensory domain FIST
MHAALLLVAISAAGLVATTAAFSPSGAIPRLPLRPPFSVVLGSSSSNSRRPFKEEPVHLHRHYCDGRRNRIVVLSGTAGGNNAGRDDDNDSEESLRPQVFATAHSLKGDLLEAIQEAVTTARSQLPTTVTAIDLCLVSVSSLYDGGSYQPATATVPALIAAAENITIRNIVGSSCAGIVGTNVLLESVPVVSVTFLVLPQTNVQCFHVDDDDVPLAGERMDKAEWLRSSGIPDVKEDAEDPVFLLIPSPAYSRQLDELLQAIESYFPTSQTIGGIASTVSSLSRAKLFCYRHQSSNNDVCFTRGCVGVILSGDITVQSLTARGAKPVGGIYSVLKAHTSTIETIVLDQVATDALRDDSDDSGDEEEEEEKVVDPANPVDKRAAMAALYAKAQIPKPVLAEANFIMRTLSDDDQAFMRRQLLVGLDQGGAVGRTASELARLARGEGHRFTVHQVASAGMKDGSVHLPLNSVNVVPGTRLRFFVRDSNFAMREIEALWSGYKQRQLSEQFNAQFDPQKETKKTASFTPGLCLILPTMDRGSKFFQGKANFETTTASRYLQTTTSPQCCIAGFYTIGVIGKMDGTSEATAKTGMQGSASGYFLFGSKSGRGVYSATAAAAQAADDARLQEALQVAADAAELRKNAQPTSMTTSTTTTAAVNKSAPRAASGELILKRRDVHSGRGLTVSTVAWSVAEKTANPSSALEGFMWDKETEVDRFRERVPLANLVSQCRLSAIDPTSPKPRDWVGALKRSAYDFVIIPECKRTDPAAAGSLWKRFDVEKLARDFTLAKAPAISVNCDPVLFGGSMEHVTMARDGASKAALSMMDEGDDGVVVRTSCTACVWPVPMRSISL